MSLNRMAAAAAQTLAQALSWALRALVVLVAGALALTLVLALLTLAVAALLVLGVRALLLGRRPGAAGFRHPAAAMAGAVWRRYREQSTRWRSPQGPTAGRRAQDVEDVPYRDASGAQIGLAPADRSPPNPPPAPPSP